MRNINQVTKRKIATNKFRARKASVKASVNQIRDIFVLTSLVSLFLFFSAATAESAGSLQLRPLRPVNYIVGIATAGINTALRLVEPIVSLEVLP